MHYLLTNSVFKQLSVYCKFSFSYMGHKKHICRWFILAYRHINHYSFVFFLFFFHRTEDYIMIIIRDNHNSFVYRLSCRDSGFFSVYIIYCIYCYLEPPAIVCLFTAVYFRKAFSQFIIDNSLPCMLSVCFASATNTHTHTHTHTQANCAKTAVCIDRRRFLTTR